MSCYLAFIIFINWDKTSCYCIFSDLHSWRWGPQGRWSLI